jgi:hypothetical protein
MTPADIAALDRTIKSLREKLLYFQEQKSKD